MHYPVWPAQVMSLAHTPHMRQPPAALLSCQATPGHPKFQIWHLQQSWPQRCCCHQEDRKPPAARLTCSGCLDVSQYVASQCIMGGLGQRTENACPSRSTSSGLSSLEAVATAPHALRLLKIMSSALTSICNQQECAGETAQHNATSNNSITG